jgi:type IV pilus assembly protein PilF
MRLAALLFVALASACAQPSSGLISEPPPPRTAPEPADADRRAAPRLELAALYYGRGQYDTALEEIRLALAAKPELGAAYSLRGLVYVAMGEDRLAEDSFARALSINPRDFDAMHNRGWFLCQRNRFEDADRMFEQALAQPQYRDVTRTVLAQGVCHARAGRLPDAEQKLVKAFELEPTNPTIALNLSEVLYRRADYERARFYIRRVNSREEQSNAQSLWLAARIENRIGNRASVEQFGRQLRNRFPQSSEAVAFERGRFDE